VAEKGPNAYGLYDMLGNAAEWVADDASGSKNRIVKGGSVAENSRLVRASARPTASPTSSDVNRGFRCVAVENLTERVLQTVAIPDRDLVSGSLTAGLGYPVYKVKGSMSPPKVIRHVDPVYPDEVRSTGEQGRVFLRAVVSSTGDVAKAEVVKGISTVLDNSAIKSVCQWKFQPAMKDAKPVAVAVDIEVGFMLGGPLH